MDIYFGGADVSTARWIGRANTLDEIYPIIRHFCDARDYKIPYIRRWEENGYVVFDVGSWTEFFYVK